MSNDNTDALNQALKDLFVPIFSERIVALRTASAKAESIKDEDARIAALETENARLRQQIEAAQKRAPVAWVRYRSDGGFEGPIMDTDARMCDTRRGFWTPLFAGPAIEVAPDNSQAAALSAENRGEDADAKLRALYIPNPPGELGPSDESQYRDGYNTALEDAIGVIAQSTARAR
ncbi:hypothetical protein SAMN05216551_107184 [Chitinasiproducens palmae]|uniref:Uncharacterized protein n=2 Tax=Chitinasiproducens palmae TaxID=1770053 RepID=A0A1H2PSU1_9BURK|nr:hypothetical protein SAMN05216551_107184 [Chitinasiproducens palmae]